MSIMQWIREDVRTDIATKMPKPTNISYALYEKDYAEAIIFLTGLIENDGKSDTYFRKDKLSKANIVRIDIEGVTVELIKTEVI